MNDDYSMREIDYPHILKTNKFDLVNEDFEDHLPFLRSKGKEMENEVKQEEIDDNDCLISKYYTKKPTQGYKNDERKVFFDINSPNYKYSEDSIYESR